MADFVPVETIAIDNALLEQHAFASASPLPSAGGDQNKIIRESPPAFPGAKHDAYGYCVSHSTVQLCQPVFFEDKQKGGADHIKKYRTLRKICPKCGVHQLVQSNVRNSQRQSSQVKEPSTKCSNQQTVKAVPKSRNHRDRLQNQKGGEKGAVKAKEKSTKRDGTTMKKDNGNYENKHQNRSKNDKLGESKDTQREEGRNVSKDGEKSKKRTGATMPKDKDIMKDTNAAHIDASAGRRHPSPYDHLKQNVSGKESKHAAERGGAIHMKQPADDNIPLTRSPNIPKYAVKLTRAGSRPTRRLPFEKDNNEAGSERATGVYMMAAGLPLHNRGSREESGDEKKNAKETTRDSNKKNKASNNSDEKQVKKSSTMDRGKPEHGNLRESHESKLPRNSNREMQGGPGKTDMSKLWESHTKINNEASYDHGKKSSRKSSSFRMEDPSKKESGRRTSRAMQTKDKHRGSLIKKDSSKSMERGIDQSKSSSANPGDDAAPRDDGCLKKNDIRDSNDMRKKYGRGSNAKNQIPARGRTKNKGERVHFQCNRSASPRKGRGGDNHATRNLEDGGRRRQYRRSKSLPQREQRKRAPSEHRAVRQPQESSNLSDYRQAFLEAMAQSSIPPT